MNKSRPISHIIGDEAIDIIKNILPKEWVIRNLTPDYGIDLLIELFGETNATKKSFETLGEFLFVQVKGKQNVEKTKLRIHPVYNVAKYKWTENKDEYIEIETISCSLDINLIETVRSIGASVSVLLFVVDTKKKKLYFICLNDYIDKVIIPQTPDYKNQGSITIHIPISNYITKKSSGLVPLKLFSKRSKLYSAFSLIKYQFRELQSEAMNPEIAFLDRPFNDIIDEKFILKQLTDYLLFFANQLQNLDIWNIGENFWALGYSKRYLDKVVKQLNTNFFKDDLNLLITTAYSVWSNLDNLNNVYEEISREWFLPKFIGQISSYENSPRVVKKKSAKK